MDFVLRSEGFKFHDPGLVPDSPGDDLPGVFTVVGFDDRPAAVGPIMAAPFEVMQIPRRMDFLDNRVTLTGIMG